MKVNIMCVKLGKEKQIACVNVACRPQYATNDLVISIKLINATKNITINTRFKHLLPPFEQNDMRKRLKGFKPTLNTMKRCEWKELQAPLITDYLPSAHLICVFDLYCGLEKKAAATNLNIHLLLFLFL